LYVEFSYSDLYSGLGRKGGSGERERRRGERRKERGERKEVKGEKRKQKKVNGNCNGNLN
jgi:hypothetical protein